MSYSRVVWLPTIVVLIFCLSNFMGCGSAEKSGPPVASENPQAEKGLSKSASSENDSPGVVFKENSGSPKKSDSPTGVPTETGNSAGLPKPKSHGSDLKIVSSAGSIDGGAVQPKKTGTNSASTRQGIRRKVAPTNDQSKMIRPSTDVRPRNHNVEPRMAIAGDLAISNEPKTPTRVTVFYATDRQSKIGIAQGDWWRVHRWAIGLGVVALASLVGTLLSRHRMIFGVVSGAGFVLFFIFLQSAMVEWQKLERLASNKDAVYLPDIRPASDDPLDFGTCEVTIPPDHRKGALDSPSLIKLEFQEDPDKHVVLNRVIRSSKDDFYRGLNEKVNESKKKQALVFVHGYNVSFENAVKRTGQIVHDLEFDGVGVCYSWSSQGALADYTRDMANADETVPTLQGFLEEIVDRTGSTTIHLVAHSMGNRAMLQALDRIAVQTENEEKMFGQLVMAAPDVSARAFHDRFANSAMELANSVTLYASDRDRALIASTEIHGHNRAGLAGDHLVVIEGMDTIDVSHIDTSLIGHSYYGDHPELIKDLKALVELAHRAEKRQWLIRLLNPKGIAYFQFQKLPIQNQSSRNN